MVPQLPRQKGKKDGKSHHPENEEETPAARPQLSQKPSLEVDQRQTSHPHVGQVKLVRRLSAARNSLQIEKSTRWNSQQRIGTGLGQQQGQLPSQRNKAVREQRRRTRGRSGGAEVRVQLPQEAQSRMAGETVQDQVEHPELNPQNKRYKNQNQPDSTRPAGVFRKQ